jgi:outer membrane protein TolC
VRGADRSIATVQAQLRDVRARHQQGSALRADVLAIEVQEAQARERRIRAGNAEALAESALRRLLDMDADGSLALSGEEWAPAELPGKFAEGLKMALRTRPELRSAARDVAAAQDGTMLARRQSWPRLDLAGRYWYDDEGLNFAADRDNWTVGATLTWTAFDGGLRRSGRRSAAAVLAEIEAMRQSTARTIELEVRRAYLNLDEARARCEVAAANVARAEESLDLVRSLFENGSATVTRYLQSEEARTAARYRDIRSRYDVKQAIADVGHALGLCLSCAVGGAIE